MTARLYAIGTYVASVEQHVALQRAGAARTRVVDVVHAVSRPVVDGLAASACGMLVSALSDLDWTGVRDAVRCPECRRITG